MLGCYIPNLAWDSAVPKGRRHIDYRTATDVSGTMAGGNGPGLLSLHGFDHSTSAEITACGIDIHDIFILIDRRILERNILFKIDLKRSAYSIIALQDFLRKVLTYTSAVNAIVNPSELLDRSIHH